MNAPKTLKEANVYLLHISSALYYLAQSHSVEKTERIFLEKQVESLTKIQASLETLEKSWIDKKELENKLDEEESEDK